MLIAVFCKHKFSVLSAWHPLLSRTGLDGLPEDEANTAATDKLKPILVSAVGMSLMSSVFWIDLSPQLSFFLQ